MTAAVILAGGNANRMGGRDKAFLVLGGRPLIAHVRARLNLQAGPLAISANGDPVRFARYGLPVLADAPPGGAGPLGGILAGLDWAAEAGESRLLTAAVDTPFLPDDLLRRLSEACRDRGADLALAATFGPRGAERLHPTFGLWPTALRTALRAALAGRAADAPAPSIRDFAARHGAVTALFPSGPPDPFFNINRPADLATAPAHAANFA
ncbi:MAG TPA: molybdenum cofactor guanylyltransferase MobA [Rhodobacteraceae bacterium]|jgi:molybdopterin-guanine dinucleotide biosynthesis protein A|nr:molybdenum cofactor guanylyltransferase MobA [Paracoccaceae bacterium]HBG97641.1 molybdenum cofactor guanylyltransferase MobA [Paracoccaceae bacterium]